MFVYGTLLDDAVVEQVTGRRFQKYAAQLVGYRRYTPAGGYPYVVAANDSTVDGMVLCDVDSAAIRAFDLYEDEGHLYRRIEVTIRVGGQPRRAFVYVAAG